MSSTHPTSVWSASLVLWAIGCATSTVSAPHIDAPVRAALAPSSDGRTDAAWIRTIATVAPDAQLREWGGYGVYPRIWYDAARTSIVVGIPDERRATFIDARTGETSEWDSGPEEGATERWNSELAHLRVASSDGIYYRWHAGGTLEEIFRGDMSGPPVGGPNGRLAWFTARGYDYHLAIFDGTRSRVVREVGTDLPATFAPNGDVYIVGNFHHADAPLLGYASDSTTAPQCFLRVPADGGPIVALRCVFWPEELRAVIDAEGRRAALAYKRTDPSDAVTGDNPATFRHLVDVEWIDLSNGASLGWIERLPRYREMGIDVHGRVIATRGRDPSGRSRTPRQDELLVWEMGTGRVWRRTLFGEGELVAQSPTGEWLFFVRAAERCEIVAIDVDRFVAGPASQHVPLATAEHAAVPIELERFWEATSPCPRGTALRGDTVLPGSVFACTEVSGRRHGPYAWIIGDRPVAWGRYERGRAEGVWRWTTARGRLFHERTYRRGVLEGLMRSWHSNGGLHEVGTHRRNRLEGQWTRYHSNGVTMRESFYGPDRDGHWDRAWDSLGRPTRWDLNGPEGLAFYVHYAPDEGTRHEHYYDGHGRALEMRTYQGTTLVQVCRENRCGTPERLPPSPELRAPVFEPYNAPRL